MKKLCKPLIFLLTALILLMGVMPVSASGDVLGEKNYSIGNPYATVDWDEWSAYKANLHAHTRYSDGEMNITDVVERYYELDYDILAITDHGVINKGWNIKPELVPVLSLYQKLLGLKPVTNERYEQIISGSDREGKGMLDVNLGIELNAAVIKKNHVNGFFCEYGQNYLGVENDYETSVKGVDDAGGVSFINHPGDFIDSADNPDTARGIKNVRKFADLLIKYDSCVGIEVFNRIDSCTRHDRILWDNILQYTIPRGVNVWAFSNDDSHKITDIGLTAEIVMMPELSNEALRTAMENGTFFACSTRARGELGNDFQGTGVFAEVTRIAVDEAKNQISIETAKPETVEWIADEKIIHVGSTIDLNQYEDEIGSYVRAQIRNEGGVLLTQAFVCDDGTLGDGITIDPLEPHEPATLWERVSAFFSVLFDFKIAQAIKKLFK